MENTPNTFCIHVYIFMCVYIDWINGAVYPYYFLSIHISYLNMLLLGHGQFPNEI